MVFENIAVTTSFRLALSLLLFGTILPPAAVKESDLCKDDAAYARCKGIRRLQTLCVQARAYLSEDNGSGHVLHCMSASNPREHAHSILNIPFDSREYILELIGAVEWLVTTSNSVTIIASQGQTCAIPLHLYDTTVGGVCCTTDPVQKLKVNPLMGIEQHGEGLDDSIIMRARAEVQTISALWRPGEQCCG